MADSTPILWEQQFREALDETDVTKIQQRIFDAEAAIYLRFEQLGGSLEHNEERDAMHKASEKLLEIKTQKLGWPHSK